MTYNSSHIIPPQRDGGYMSISHMTSSPFQRIRNYLKYAKGWAINSTIPLTIMIVGLLGGQTYF